jgi:hypothetical protein
MVHRYKFLKNGHGLFKGHVSYSPDETEESHEKNSGRKPVLLRTIHTK